MDDDRQQREGDRAQGSDGSQVREGWIQRLGRKGLIWIGGVLTVVAAGVITPLVLSAGKKIVSGPEQFLSVSVRNISPADSCNGGTGWVFPIAPNHLPAPSQHDPPTLQTWAVAHRASPASGNLVVLDIQGMGDHTVILDDIRVSVVRRSPAPAGTYPVLSGGCGGIVPDRYVANLDRTPVVVTPKQGLNQAGNPVAAVPLPHQVSSTDVEVWDIQPMTMNCSCEWRAYIDWTSDGIQGHTVIDDAGRPFITTATRRSTIVFPNAHGGWTRQ